MSEEKLPKHVFPIYPPIGDQRMMELHEKRKQRERRFPGVDIDAIHYKLGAVKKKRT